MDWLVTTRQNDDGGYTSFSAGANMAPSDVSGSLDAMQAIAAAGYNPATNAPGKTSNPVAYLQANVTDVAAFATDGGGKAGKVILGLTAASQDPYDFMGYNFVISLTAQLSPTGQYNAVTAYDQSPGAASPGGRSPNRPSLRYPMAQRCPVGQWLLAFLWL
ncbi:MAG: hypothetical protein M5U34_14750 [Chloroflexi bacterium]|nr:hypothetical protein [Chloroflexota bacterium]